MRAFRLCASLCTLQLAHAFAPFSSQSGRGKSHLPQRQVTMQSHESLGIPKSTRRALLAALAASFSAMPQPSNAIWPFDPPEKKSLIDPKDAEKDKEYFNSEEAKAAIATLIEFQSKTSEVIGQVEKDKDLDLAPILANDFDIQKFRLAVNVIFDGFDEDAQDTIGAYQTSIINQLNNLESSYGQFKKGKTTRGPKSTERVLGCFGSVKRDVAKILSFVQ